MSFHYIQSIMGRFKRYPFEILTTSGIAVVIAVYFIVLPLNDALTLIFASFTVVLMLRDIKYGIAFFIVVSIFPQVQSREIFGITGLNAQNIIFLGVVASYFLQSGQRREKSEKHSLSILKWMIVLIVLQVFSVLRMIYEKGELYDYYFRSEISALSMTALKPIEYYIILYILYKIIKDKKDIKFFLYIFYTGMFIGVIVLFWQYVIVGYVPYSAQMWQNPFAGHKNVFGLTMVILCLISISFFLNINDTKLKYFSFAIAIFSFVVLAYSLSRNAWAGFLFGLFYIVYKLRAVKVLIPVFLLLLVVLFTPISSMISQRATQNLETGNLDLILAGRIESKWKPQIEGIKANPLLGGGAVGLLGHNGYLSVWNKVGILGLIITITVFYKMYKMFGALHKSSPSKGIERSFSLAGLSCVFIIPFINIAGSLELLRVEDLASIFFIFFVYLSSHKLLVWQKSETKNPDIDSSQI